MNYLAIKDLNKTGYVQDLLETEREIILTHDGTPCALMIGITPETIEESLSVVRRALFSGAVLAARKRAAKNPPRQDEIRREIAANRKSRDGA